MPIGSHTIQLYTGTAAEFATRNPVLAVGQMGQELDTDTVTVKVA